MAARLTLCTILFLLMTVTKVHGSSSASSNPSPTSTPDPGCKTDKPAVYLLIALPLVFSLISAGTAAGVAVIVMKTELEKVKKAETAAFEVMDGVMRALIPVNLLSKIGEKGNDKKDNENLPEPPVPPKTPKSPKSSKRNSEQSKSKSSQNSE